MTLSQDDRKKRAHRITGTRIGKILNLYVEDEVNPFGGPLRAWQEIRGIAPEVKENEAIILGQELEAGIIRSYTRMTGHDVHDTGTLVYKPDPRFACTPDGLVNLEDGTTRVIEVKTARNGAAWGTPGTDQIPLYYVPQVVWEMMCADAKEADILGFFGGTLNIYHMKRDYELEALMREKAVEFWDKFIETNRAPLQEETRAEDVGKYLNEHYTQDTKEFIDSTSEIDDLVAQFGLAKYEYDRWGDIKKGVENEIKKRIGTNAGIRSDNYKVSWTAVKPRSSLDTAAMEADGIDLSKYKKLGRSYRRFMVKDFTSDGPKKHGPADLRKSLGI